MLDNTERWIDLAQAHVQASPNSEYLREISQVNGSARSEILVFLSFYIAKEELTVDILKAKNVTGLFPVRAQSETGMLEFPFENYAFVVLSKKKFHISGKPNLQLILR